MQSRFPGLLPARRWLSLLLAGVVCLAGWEVLLTRRVLEQDRNLELQRQRERLAGVADLSVAQLATTLGDWNIKLHELNLLPPPSFQQAQFPVGSTLVVFSKQNITLYPWRPLLFTRMAHAETQLSTANLFDTADELELRDQQYNRAIAVLEPLEHDAGTRPEALLRLGRIEHKMRRDSEALNAYKSLQVEAALNRSGLPYALLATTARCRILKAIGRQEEASREANALRQDLSDGRWPLSREAFEFHWRELAELGASSNPARRSDVDFSALVSDLYDRWRSAQARSSDEDGRELLPDSSLLLWNSTSDRSSALVTSSNWIIFTVKFPRDSGDIRWRLLSAGQSGGTGFAVTRSLADAQLPGRLEFSSSQFVSPAGSSRRMLLMTGAGMMVIVILGSGYVVFRAVSKELRVAKLQSDFVAAVSHEFRSPLTTLRTITELLAQDRITDEKRRRQSYVFLDRETSRLHHLVEDLLDFGRMESGRRQYVVEPHDAFELVRFALEDVTELAQANGFCVDATLDDVEAPIRADEEAVRRAVRNLIENAIKYSADCRTVWVDGKVANRQVTISVRDHGMGIDPTEQRAIFQKFVRGQAAKQAGIKGTGIGLAMVQQICAAMGGQIHLTSEVGTGSTFTIVLPLARD